MGESNLDTWCRRGGRGQSGFEGTLSANALTLTLAKTHTYIYFYVPTPVPLTLSSLMLSYLLPPKIHWLSFIYFFLPCLILPAYPAPSQNPSQYAFLPRPKPGP